MKKNIKKLLLGILFYFIGTCLNFCYSQDTTDRNFNYDLVPILITNDYQTYYAKVSTFKAEYEYNKQYKIWLYIYPRDGYYKECVQGLYKETKNSMYLNFDVEKRLYYVDCDDDKICLTKYVCYNKKGDIISENDTTYKDWNIATPETIGEMILNYVCSLVK